jgi:hypothetical protein
MPRWPHSIASVFSLSPFTATGTRPSKLLGDAPPAIRANTRLLQHHLENTFSWCVLWECRLISDGLLIVMAIATFREKIEQERYNAS